MSRPMRIASGDMKGRKFQAPSGHRTRPMGERIKTALFNILGDIEELTVLDAYGGSGGLAFEAASRGASLVQVIEKDAAAFRTIQKNVLDLSLSEKVKVTHADCKSWSKNNKDTKFDVILCDPPFDQLNLSTISELTNHLKSSSIMVLSHTGRETSPTVNGVVVVDNRTYGDAALSLYRLGL